MLDTRVIHCTVVYLVLRDDGVGVGHEGDESIKHQAVGHCTVVTLFWLTMEQVLDIGVIV